MPKRYRQLWVKDSPKVSTWRLERDLNPQPSVLEASNLPLSHHAPLWCYYRAIRRPLFTLTYFTVVLAWNVLSCPRCNVSQSVVCALVDWSLKTWTVHFMHFFREIMPLMIIHLDLLCCCVDLYPTELAFVPLCCFMLKCLCYLINLHLACLGVRGCREDGNVPPT